jgi:cytochrome c-type biogenesis protein CcmH/NrfF
MGLEIAKWVKMGKSDREILDTYVALYGSKVLVDPRTIPAGWTSWIPWTVLAIGTVLLTCFLKRWRPRVEASHPASGLEGRSLANIEIEDDDADL